MKSEQEHWKRILTESIKSFINDNVKCHNSMSVEGLMGVTLNSEVFLVYVNESYTGVIGGTAANSDSCNGEANEGSGVVSDERSISCTRNDELSTLADRDVDINGSYGANISQGIDDVVAETKPVIIVSCWSEAATQEADLGVSQGETSSTRITEVQCNVDHSHDFRTTSTSTSVLRDLLLVLTPTEQRSEAEIVRDEAGGLQCTTENTGQRSLVKDRDMVSGDSDRCVTGSATLKLDQLGTSDDRQSTQRVNKRHVCDVCNKVFSHNCYLARHKRIHARYGYGKNTASKCNEGCKQSGSRVPEHNMSSGEQSVVGGNVCYCDICELTFPCMSKTISNMRTHTGEKPFTSEVCSQHSQVTTHLRTHPDEKRYACEMCNKAYSRRSQVTVHMRTHTGEKPFACEICKRAFICPGHLTRHTRIHTGEKPYVCKVCQKGFKDSGNLFRHERTHTVEKLYVCTVCNMAFNVRRYLTKHMRTHTSGRPNTCKVCNSSFRFSKQLIKHMRIHD